MFRLLVTVDVVPSSPTLVILMMEAIRSSEMSVLTRVTLGNIPEDGTLQSTAVKNSNLTKTRLLKNGVFSDILI
jgi:hypothetical protein